MKPRNTSNADEVDHRWSVLAAQWHERESRVNAPPGLTEETMKRVISARRRHRFEWLGVAATVAVAAVVAGIVLSGGLDRSSPASVRAQLLSVEVAEAAGDGAHRVPPINDPCYSASSCIDLGTALWSVSVP